MALFLISFVLRTIIPDQKGVGRASLHGFSSRLVLRKIFCVRGCGRFYAHLLEKLIVCCTKK